MSTHEWVEIEDSNGAPARVPAFRYRASHDGYWEMAPCADWANGPAGSPARCLTPLTRNAKGHVVIAKRRIAFKAGEEVLIPASENVHQYQCNHEDCAQRKLYCRDESHNPHKMVVGGAMGLTLVDRPIALSPQLQADQEQVALLERRPPAMPRMPQPPAPTDTDSLFMAKVREARAARAAQGGTK